MKPLFTEMANRCLSTCNIHLAAQTIFAGYERCRFYDNGSSVLSGEYRWPVSQTLELALFGDGGNVYQRAGLIGLRDLRGDGGFGIRFKNKQTTVMRLDVGFSPEGVKVWFVFNGSFSKLSRSY